MPLKKGNIMNKIYDIDIEDRIIDKMIKPYIILSKILFILLLISVIGNIYLATKKVDITLIANNNKQSDVTQTNE